MACAPVASTASWRPTGTAACRSNGRTPSGASSASGSPSTSIPRRSPTRSRPCRGRARSKKLGFKPGMRAAFLQAPEDFEATLGELPGGVEVRRRLQDGLDLVVCFVTARRELERRLDRLRAAIAPDGMLWVAWPKRA